MEDLKKYVVSSNHTFKQRDVKELISEGLQRIDQQRWEKACFRVQKLEGNWRARDNIQDNTLQVVIIQLDNTVQVVIVQLDDTDDGDSNDSDSDTDE